MYSVLSCGKCLLYLLLFINLFAVNNCIKLRGVTILNWPYVDKYLDNNGDIVYDGFAIDLIDKIAKSAGFDYELKEVPDGRYGVYDPGTGRIDGLIAELHHNRADFAVADLTITEERKRFVDFTDPFMSSNIAAIVRKKYGQHLQTFSDLYYQTDLSYGVIMHSATHHYFHHSKDSILRKMYERMDQNRDVFVRSRTEGIERVNTTHYAFISESASLEFIADFDCELMVVYDTNGEFPDSQRHYAIALRKGNSTYLNAFNFALSQLNKTGQLEELTNRYWEKTCQPPHDSENVDINSCHSLDFISINIILVLFLIFMKILNL